MAFDLNYNKFLNSLKEKTEKCNFKFLENKVDENISTNGLWIIESKNRDQGGRVSKYSEVRLKNL